MDEFVDPLLGRMVAVKAEGCSGCRYQGVPDACHRSPMCFTDDDESIIWVRAEDAPQEPKAARLTDEQIAQIIALTWGSVDIAPQSAAAFARAVEAAAIKANNLEMPE